MGKTIRMPAGSPKYLKDLPNNLRVEPLSFEPYPKSKPKKGTRKQSNDDKENADAIVKPKSRAKKAGVKSSSKINSENTDGNPEPKARVPKPKKVPEAQQQYSDWREIELEEVWAEVCCYDNAAAVRRKLKKLLSDKNLIPCSDGKKRWTQASMSAEMTGLESMDGAVEYNRNAKGPSVGSLAGFLKKTGNMGGGDSPAYYWGYVLCEKLRIWGSLSLLSISVPITGISNLRHVSAASALKTHFFFSSLSTRNNANSEKIEGEKKTKAREEAEV